MLLKIKPVKNLEGGFAGYSFLDGIIYYDKRLDHYPKLKKEILKHEFDHLLHKHKAFYHLYIDIRDIKLFIRYDFFKYYILETDIQKHKTNDFKILLIYTIFSPIVDIIKIPFLIFGLVINIFYDRLIKK